MPEDDRWAERHTHTDEELQHPALKALAEGVEVSTTAQAVQHTLTPDGIHTRQVGSTVEVNPTGTIEDGHQPFRSFYGIPDSMLACPCGDGECDYFESGYPFCHGCGEHHRMPVGDPCPVGTGQETSENCERVSRGWVQGVCGNCGRSTDRLPCPYCPTPPQNNISTGADRP